MCILPPPPDAPAVKQGRKDPMRYLLVPAALALSLAAGSAAFATPPAKPAKPAATSSSKAADCMKQWRAQKTHTESRKAFLAACEKG